MQKMTKGGKNEAKTDRRLGQLMCDREINCVFDVNKLWQPKSVLTEADQMWLSKLLTVLRRDEMRLDHHKLQLRKTYIHAYSDFLHFIMMYLLNL